jgi:hypothetical protein
MKNNNITKKIMTIALGGLLLSAPLAASYATQNSDDINNVEKIQLTNEDHLEFVKAALDLQIEHANELINSVDEDFDTDRLKAIVLEYAELEEFLDSVEVESMLKEELRETFFEFREESKELSKEFKSIIKTAFNEEERESFREEFKADKAALKEEYNTPDHKKERAEKHRSPKLTLDQINSIDSTIGEALENEEISYMDAMKEVKEILDDMEKEDRKELFESLDIQKKDKKIRN